MVTQKEFLISWSGAVMKVRVVDDDQLLETMGRDAVAVYNEEIGTNFKFFETTKAEYEDVWSFANVFGTRLYELTISVQNPSSTNKKVEKIEKKVWSGSTYQVKEIINYDEAMKKKRKRKRGSKIYSRKEDHHRLTLEEIKNIKDDSLYQHAIECCDREFLPNEDKILEANDVYIDWKCLETKEKYVEGGSFKFSKHSIIITRKTDTGPKDGWLLIISVVNWYQTLTSREENIFKSFNEFIETLPDCNNTAEEEKNGPCDTSLLKMCCNLFWAPQFVTMAMYALTVHNFKKRTQLKFSRILSLHCRCVGCGMIYLFEIEAFDLQHGGIARAFKTIVYDLRDTCYSTPVIPFEKPLPKDLAELFTGPLSRPYCTSCPMMQVEEF